MGETRQGRGVRENAVWSVSQHVVTAACTFIAYKVAIDHAGIAGLGLFALLMSAATLLRIVDVSGAGILYRYVGRDAPRRSAAAPELYVETVVVSVIAINLVLCLVALFVIAPILARLAPASQVNDILVLWPGLVIAHVLLSPLVVTLNSALDGRLRTDVRAKISCLSSILMLGAAWWLVPRLGLVGLAIAQIIQMFCGAFGGWLALKRIMPQLGWVPTRWVRAVAVETSQLGFKLQVLNTATILIEPVMKFALGLTGGLAAVGMYELAQKLVMQIRGFVAAAFQPLLPRLVGSKSDGLLTTMRWPAFASGCAIFLVSCAAAPALSVVVLGRLDHTLSTVVATISAGLATNALAIPHYQLGLAKDTLKWNILAQFVVSACVLAATAHAVTRFSQPYVLVAYATGFAFGAVLVVIGNGLAHSSRDLTRSWCNLLLLFVLVTGLSAWIGRIYLAQQ